MAHRLRRPHQPPQHRYGWHRTRLTTLTGARTWCGHGILAHNLVKITTLAADQAR
jgi:IS5 family transposase